MIFRLLLVYLCVASLPSATAADEERAKALIELAIERGGGRAALETHKASMWKEKGTYFGEGEGVPYTGSSAVLWPDHFRVEVAEMFTIVLAGDQGWIKSDGQTRAMTEEELTSQREQHYVAWVTTLQPLLGQQFAYEYLGRAEVNGSKVEGVRVRSAGHQDVELYFDTQTGLLFQSRSTVTETETGKVTPQSTLYREYKKVAGVMIPSLIEVRRNDKKFVEATIYDVTIVSEPKLDWFVKP